MHFVLLFLSILSIPFLSIPLITIILALITSLLNRLQNRTLSKCRSSIYSGRVSHTRFEPVPHSFGYPLFFMFLDLNETSDLFVNDGIKPSLLWPLNLLMRFRESDHLKNDEGRIEEGDGLSDRIRRLVSERTDDKCTIKKDDRVVLLTHLCYFGYCFNPVSFYYILERDGDDRDTVRAIVAEVSNTPWIEMKCYVLHPDSRDVTKAQPGRTHSDGTRSVNYIFDKTFHVSPFMEMEHVYNWTFWHPADDRIVVSTDMDHIRTKKKYFNAYFNIKRESLSPLFLCYQLLRFPVYCVIIQIWIHIEAFRVFMKGVSFVPHPENKETGASQIIGAVMAPFFKLKDMWSGNEPVKED